MESDDESGADFRSTSPANSSQPMEMEGDASNNNFWGSWPSPTSSMDAEATTNPSVSRFSGPFQPLLKMPTLAVENPIIKAKLVEYLAKFSSAVRSGEFVVQTKPYNAPSIGLKVIETGKLLKFPLQEDEVAMEEIAVSDFEIMNNEEWAKFESSIVDQVGSQFGLNDTGRISASLKKLIIQKPGSTFPTNLDQLFDRSDQDVDIDNNQGGRGEGSPSNCFGHLVIHLPSHYTGGHFRFEHEENVKEFDMSANMTTIEGWTTQYLAYYPQVEHHHGEILSGVRSCLIYNLEIESDFKPQAPTIKKIVPSLSQIIQEWKETDQTTKFVPLMCDNINFEINPTVFSTFLAPSMRDAGVTLFHGRIGILTYFDGIYGSVDDDVITRLRILSSTDRHMEEAFRSFLQDEQIDYQEFEGIISYDDQDPDDVEYIDDRGLKFDLALGNEEEMDHRSEKFLFFRSDDVDFFKNARWVKNLQFWRFQSYLFLTKYADSEETTTEVLQAADALVSIEIDRRDRRDLFPNLPHFENLLNKFLLLEDTVLLRKLLKICTDQPNFDTLFPTLLTCGMPWPILRSGLHYRFHPDRFETGKQFIAKFKKFASHIQQVFSVRDQNCEELYYAVFDSMLQQFQELRKAKDFVRQQDVEVVLNFFLVSQTMEYDLFKFVKSLPATFVRRVILMNSSVPDAASSMGVTWVKLVTDLYCCTNFFENWPDEEVENPQEATFLLGFFKLAQKVGADIRGILGNVKKYGLFVLVLARVANLNENQPGVLPKFWIPFSTRLEARIEGVMYPDVVRTRKKSAIFSVREGTEMLQEIRKLLESAKQQ